MTEEQSYTTEEISKLLKISKLTVYDLIKKGDLVAYRVGKQMRVDATDLEAYKQRSKQLQSPAHRAAVDSVPPLNLIPGREVIRPIIPFIPLQVLLLYPERHSQLQAP